MALRERVILAALMVAALVLRIGVRVAFGEDYFWTNSYYFYYAIAENILSGEGFCSGTVCAGRPPLYPLFLAMTALPGKNYLLIIIPQAAMGAGTALCAFLIGRHIFNVRTGLIACGITAFYPYYVVHDTALQETVMVTFCIALSIWLLLRASTRSRNRDWFLAGLVLGASALVRTSAVPVAAVALIWTAIWGAQGHLMARLRQGSFLLLAFMIGLGPWLVRNYHLTGAPVLSSETGYLLWVGNNAETFSRYPAGSIDRSRDEAMAKLTQSDLLELERIRHDEIATSNWFAGRALNFIGANPWPVLQGAVRKLEAGFSWRLNPLREPLAQTVYAIGYVPVAILGIIGMLLAWPRREVILIALLFLAFMGVTAAFWAHTSHRSYLDVYWIVFAASTAELFWKRFMCRYFQGKSAVE